jgi:PhoPQ-activated pathogenicity-related protein
MVRLIRLAVLAVALVQLAPARADLAAYFSKPEPHYRWEQRAETKAEGVTIYDLQMVSQTWRGKEWEHRLVIYRPDSTDHPRLCMLDNAGGSGSKYNDAMALSMARETGAIHAILYNIPNQPLFGGKYEDALVVHTWIQFLQTGDESWPLHFPMAKAVLKAMDAIQEFFKQHNLPHVDGFLISGASKRGWAAWLAAASRDARIKAVVPMVIDTLNLPAQSEYQMSYYGGGSEQIRDYANAGMYDALKTPRGKRLIELVDPYSYREILTLPKLLILGTNDRYWPQDALNLYWDGLEGPKWVMYAPNSGHRLDDRERVLNTVGAFVRATAENKRWPKQHWSYTESTSGVDLHFGSDLKPVSARLFRAYAPTTDFRDSKWTSEEVRPSENGFTARFASPQEGYAAIFGEATYDLDRRSFTLSTPIRIVPPSSSPPPAHTGR